jgi:hypothetical protein
MHTTIRIMAAGFIVIGLSVSPALSEAEKPIISQLFDNTKGYDGRRITIYGLVIETANSGNEFMLQDVSQMPLKVKRLDRFRVFVGDQIIVQGIFQESKGEPFLQARQIIYAKVLGGGGCC